MIRGGVKMATTMSESRAEQAAETPGTTAVLVRGLTKTYAGGVEAVKRIDFDVQSSEVFGLLGPNGAGKSTTIGMLTTTIRPTAGSASLAGFDVTEQPLAARSVSSVVFQDPVVDRSLSGKANLQIHADLWSVPKREASARIAEISAALGVEDLLSRPLASYSGGQRRRLEIARALISRPRVLFLDEPTVGLDPRIRTELLDVIAGLRARFEMTILLTTHYLDEADRLCDRIAVMHLGEIVACDSPAALRGAFGSEVLELQIEGDGEAVLSRIRAEALSDEYAFAVGSRLTLPVRERAASEVLLKVEALGVKAAVVTTRPPTLDDVYLRLTGGSLTAGAHE
jgi:ABC-2 type transport system ATP-binding protein